MVVLGHHPQDDVKREKRSSLKEEIQVEEKSTIVMKNNSSW